MRHLVALGGERGGGWGWGWGGCLWRARVGRKWQRTDVAGLVPFRTAAARSWSLLLLDFTRLLQLPLSRPLLPWLLLLLLRSFVLLPPLSSSLLLHGSPPAFTLQREFHQNPKVLIGMAQSRTRRGRPRLSGGVACPSSGQRPNNKFVYLKSTSKFGPL